MNFRMKVLGYGMTFFLFLLVPFQLTAQNPGFEEAVKKYIEIYHRIAVEEMIIYKIPASITLAQGIFESDAGRSDLATEANNHFGIKCHKEWTGETFYKDDEKKNECFRKYEKPEESFRDHSYFLTQRDRYRSLFSLDVTDYKGWAQGLKQAGYATNPKYADLLIKHIEVYKLYRFDNPDFSKEYEDSLKGPTDSLTDRSKKISQFEIVKQGPEHHAVYKINSVKLTIALKGDSWAKLSAQFQIPQKRLYKFNDLKKGARLVAGQLVFLEMKRKKGAVQYHLVKQGETMYTISQLNGIQLKQLYKKNKIETGHSLRPGEKLMLR